MIEYMLDITERKKVQKLLAERSAALARSNAELEQFAYVVSHDLREPARMVKSYLALLARRYRGQLDESADTFIDYAVDGAERMQEMISALLNLSRVETRGEAFVPTDVEAVVKRTLTALSRAIEDAGVEVLERYAAELRRSNEELEQFAYVVSHDLREPARMVKSYLELLTRRYRGQLDESADTFITYAVDGANRMQEMIGALLDLSRVGTRGKAFAPTDVGAVVDRTLVTLSRAIEDAGAEVRYDLLPTVMADQAQLGQVFQNLIANAIKFRREGVAPRVHISAVPSPGLATHAGMEGEWRFSVADNGIGIDPRQVDRIFQIFQRLHTREEYEGLGIGLALCRRIVERHGGRIWVESEPGKGSTFSFTISVQREGS